MFGHPVKTDPSASKRHKSVQRKFNEAKANLLSENKAECIGDKIEQRKAIVDKLNESQDYFNYTRATLNFV